MNKLVIPILTLLMSMGAWAEERLEMYVYHHGETQEYSEMQDALDDFMLEHDELIDEFREWLVW